MNHTARLATEKAVFRPALPLCFSPEFTGGHMARATSYADQLKHPNWQRKRLEILQAANFGCEKCGATEKTLHVHHKKYVKGRKAWEYSRDELASLCEDCHEREHSMKDALDTLLARQWMDKGMSGVDIAAGFLAGFLAPFARGDAGLEKVFSDAIAQDWPFFDLGFMVAALGPDDLMAAVKRKRSEGGLPEDSPLLSMVLGEAEGD